MKTRSTASGAKPLFYPRLLEIFDQPYGRSALLADVMAGVTVGLIALPLLCPAAQRLGNQIS